MIRQIYIILILLMPTLHLYFPEKKCELKIYLPPSFNGDRKADRHWCFKKKKKTFLNILFLATLLDWLQSGLVPTILLKICSCQDRKLFQYTWLLKPLQCTYAIFYGVLISFEFWFTWICCKFQPRYTVSTNFLQNYNI